jgi:hypothetical protein
LLSLLLCRITTIKAGSYWLSQGPPLSMILATSSAAAAGPACVASAHSRARDVCIGLANFPTCSKVQASTFSGISTGTSGTRVSSAQGLAITQALPRLSSAYVTVYCTVSRVRLPAACAHSHPGFVLQPTRLYTASAVTPKAVVHLWDVVVTPCRRLRRHQTWGS